MAKRTSKADEQKRGYKQAQALAEWTANGRDPKEAERLGIMAGLFTKELSEVEKVEAKLEQAVLKHSEALDELKDEAIRLWKADDKSATALGKALWKVHAKMNAEHGAFKHWYESEKMEKNRVYYCMRLVAPKGNKVKAAKERRKRTPRAQAFHVVTTKLNKLYELAEANKHGEAMELYRQVCDEIKERFVAPFRMKAAAAGAA